MADSRLSTPGRISIWRRNSSDDDTFGRFAETFARFMGTPAFLGWMTVFVIIWVAINVIGLFGLKWDPYPFILLNLFFSTQASYSAPLILLAENRQTDRDHVRLAEDRKQASQSRADMDFLAREIASLRASVSEMATRDYIRSELRNELREMLAELDDDERDGEDQSRGEREWQRRTPVDRP
ncbi:Uncharacterized membrane protein [Raineyella antarctica]|uniref:Uncharacterized membrane protein n=1 Tax=Raineyella antarctica TaxID=1577474 RepID=A0A1G6GDL7_9ACTN|nr:DUF1003 domain-containing protein [Raineyella antarctica]SDB80064.1 Uncharacterized membrane protein [Raineyella antarctica]